VTDSPADSPADSPIEPPAGPPADAFASSLATLEAHVAAADRAGEAVPSETRRMLAQLRELSGAIRALAESMGQPAADAPRADEE